MWGEDGVADNYPLHDLSRPGKISDTNTMQNLILSIDFGMMIAIFVF
jgi:hypothetical protein